MGVFDRIATAKPPMGGGTHFRQGEYLVECEALKVIVSANPKTKGQHMVVFESTILEVLADPTGNANKAGERCTRILAIESKDDSGADFALSECRSLVAALVNAPFDSIGKDHCETATSDDGTASKGARCVVVAAPTRQGKTDEAGNVYQNLTYEPDPSAAE